MAAWSRGVAFCLIVLVLGNGWAAEQDSSQHWVATWATSDVTNERPVSFSNQTIRNVVHTSIGGSEIRIRLSNVFGTRAVRFDAVHVGLQQGGSAIVPASDRVVTFGGDTKAAIPPGAEALSDSIALSVQAQSDLAISLYSAGDTGTATVHSSAFQTSYVSGPGNFVSNQDGKSFTETTGSWFFLSAVDVVAPEKYAAVVALGDSITDGTATPPDKNERWTDVLARRFLAEHVPLAVLNAGIGGNRLLTDSPCWGVNAVARLPRDVLSQTGGRAAILFEGTNDIGQPDTPAGVNNPCLGRTPVTADEIIAADKQIIAQTHARGWKIFGATILPYQGFRGWTTAGEAKRTAVNHWIRTSGVFDGLIDFDAAVRDPANPARLAPQFDSGDHLHPGTAGHEAMGKAVDLTLFR